MLNWHDINSVKKIALRKRQIIYKQLDNNTPIYRDALKHMLYA